MEQTYTIDADDVVLESFKIQEEFAICALASHGEVYQQQEPWQWAASRGVHFKGDQVYGKIVELQ